MTSLTRPARNLLTDGAPSWQLCVAQAPRDFITAIACLLDNQVAEKAYEVIYKCRRGERI